MIEFESKGSFKNTEDWLRRMQKGEIFNVLDKYGQKGVAALSAATPRDSGETANSWTYKVSKRGKSYSIVWSNNHVENGVNIAVLLNYGHATRTGGYVQGRHYIAAAIQPIFDEIAKDVWKEVTRR